MSAQSLVLGGCRSCRAPSPRAALQICKDGYSLRQTACKVDIAAELYKQLVTALLVAMLTYLHMFHPHKQMLGVDGLV